ncbi:hypothetical protein F5Y15DRAFT_380140 [Xylariaceae sp. FL0016]|nr:hypothetical protein F5Y15DRAFT_380140 [Xylariaceae sp. FL0016]
MWKIALVSSLAGIGSAIPLSPRQSVPHYPPSSTSTGFHLVANVTDPSTDLPTSVNGWVFQGIHIGAGFNDAVLEAKSVNSSGRILYHNGTSEEIRYGQGSILSDGGTPLSPYGIYVQAENETDSTYPEEHDVSLNVGSGTIGVSIAAFPNPYFYLTGNAPGLFVACSRVVTYYNQEFIVLRYVYDTVDENTGLNPRTIPDACTAVNLIPECDTLPELPEGSLSNHEYAQSTRCYDDVSAIDWSEYGP